jgi:putative ABC transport system permease protein
MMLGEIRSAEKVALLGKSVAKELFGDVSAIDQVIRVNHVPFTVIGVLAAKGPAPWGGDQDDVVFMPLSTAKKRVFGGRQLRDDLLGQITVKVASAEAVETAERDITQLLRRRHKLNPEAPSDFYIRNLAETLEASAKSSRVMANVLAAVAAVSLMVGGIGIMNIMLVSVTERTREIGIRMAVGAKRRDVMLQFLFEALALSIIGGLVGIAFGVVGSAMISRFAGWPTLVGAPAIAAAVLFSSAVGIFFGYYPARKASRIDPIEALRNE